MPPKAGLQHCTFKTISTISWIQDRSEIAHLRQGLHDGVKSGLVEEGDGNARLSWISVNHTVRSWHIGTICPHFQHVAWRAGTSRDFSVAGFMERNTLELTYTVA